MVLSEMRIAAPEVDTVANEMELLSELLPLEGARVLELGCGKAEKTRQIAARAAHVLALEVDEIQLAQNRTITDLANVRFDHGGAEKIPVPDSSIDIVLMFKSLHHVPMELMDQAFDEIQRVLRPGGLAYISEPVYAGAFNEILRLFNDEKTVREAAFAAEQRAHQSQRLELLSQRFFLQPMHFDGFEQFEEQVLKVTHSDFRLSREIYEEVHSRFSQHVTPNGADFKMPIRVDLFCKAVGAVL